MKQIFIIMGILSFWGCSQNNKLPQEEVELLKSVEFDIDLISKLKDKTNTKIEQLPAIEQETGDVLTEKYKGIYTNVSEEKSVNLVKSLKSEFRSKGYLIFVMDAENGSTSIAVIKGENDLDILKYRRTDGINHDLNNDAIVSKISEWKEKYGLTVIGCSRDWLQVEFDKMPENLKEFSEEVYKFCPDAVDQGVGDIETLQLAIQQMHGIWLWWD